MDQILPKRHGGKEGEDEVTGREGSRRSIERGSRAVYLKC